MADDIRSRRAQVLYWAATVLGAIAFLVPGILNLVHAPHVAGDMKHLGYPRYFSTILGTWKVLAAIAVLLPRTPRLKEWAYAGMVFDLTGAAASRLVVGDALLTIATPLMIACVVATSWRLRPPGRRLDAASPGHTPLSFPTPFALSGVTRGETST